MRFEQLLASVGSVIPPALLEAGYPQLDIVSGGFPAETEQLELEVIRGTNLRGVFVPAELDDAPIVVHLLESLGSVTYGTKGLLGYPCLWSLRENGFSSLMVDYRGIGASDGQRSPRNMHADATAMYAEAMRRTNGDETRIAVRALSLGTLAAAALCKDHATITRMESLARRPAGVIMIAPVRAETVAGNWLGKYHGRIVKLFASLTNMRRPVKVNQVAVMAGLKAPLLVYSPEKDYALPPEEMTMLKASCAQAGGEWHSSPYNHSGHVLTSHDVIPAEIKFLRNLFGLEASGDLAEDGATKAKRIWMRLLDQRQLRRYPAEALAALWHLAEDESPQQLLQLRRETKCDDLVSGIRTSTILRAHGVPVRTVGDSAQYFCLEQKTWVDCE